MALKLLILSYIYKLYEYLMELQWLILQVRLTGPRDTWRAGKTLFLSVPVRVLLEEISIWIRLSKDPPSPMWVGSIQSTADPNRTIKQRKSKFSLSSWVEMSILPCLWTSELHSPSSQSFGLGMGVSLSAPLVLRPLDSVWIIPLIFLSLQLIDGILWHILASIITWANSHNKYPLMYFYISSWVLILWKTPTEIPSYMILELSVQKDNWSPEAVNYTTLLCIFNSPKAHRIPGLNGVLKVINSSHLTPE